MNHCVRALPDTGGAVDLIVLAGLLLAIGITVVLLSRRTGGRLLFVGIPMMAVLTFQTPETPTDTGCEWSSFDLPLRTSPAPTEAPTALTVVFLGELLFQNTTPFSPYFGPLDYVDSTSVCETNAPANCVTFTKGANGSVNASESLQMTANGTLTLDDSSPCHVALLYDVNLTPQDAQSSINQQGQTPIANSPNSPGSTMGSYSNTDTVYIFFMIGC